MTLEEKQLLLKDLCARLPYGVKGTITYDKGNTTFTVEGIDNDVLHLSDAEECYIEDFKPYLRPMSNMTEEERKKWYKESYVDYDCEFQPTPTLGLEYCHLSTDWLNAHHFDYRGLIEKGLALVAPEGMYTDDKFVPITKEELEKTRISSKDYLI